MKMQWASIRWVALLPVVMTSTWANSVGAVPLTTSLREPEALVEPELAEPHPNAMLSASSATGQNSAQPSALLQQLRQFTVPELPALDSVEPFLPAPNPKALTYLVIRLSDRRVYVYHRDQVKTSFPIAIGRAGWETPTGNYQVMQMIRNPAWQHPFTGEVVPPGADNPLGSRWIGFWTDGTNFIGFHGTPNEESVGRPASHGCIRMYDRDVTKLFEMVEVGTRVEVVP